MIEKFSFASEDIGDVVGLIPWLKPLMYCGQSARVWHLLIASFWLLLTVIRQILDSIGRLWVPIVFNSFQIISCICGLIAVVHWRKRLLVAFMLLNFTSVIYNIALILWYNELLDISTDVPILGARFTYSHSFFLRYTPSCKAYYNSTNLRWTQLACFIPYYHIEGAQALLHIFMANFSIILSIVLLPKRDFNKSQGRASLIDQEANKQYVGPGNIYKRHSVKQYTRKGCSEAASAHQNPNNFQKLSVVKCSRSMTDLASECREMGQTSGGKDHQPISITNLIYAANRSRVTATKSANSEHVHRSGSLKSFKMPTTEGIRRIFSREEINLADNLRTVPTNSNLKSLVSFDPKSNVLLRIHKHVDDDGDDDDYDCYGDRGDDSTGHELQQQQQRKPRNNPSIVEAVEQIPYQNSKYPLSINNLSTTCRLNNLTFRFTDTDNNGCHNPTSFGKNCNQRSLNFPKRQPIWYTNTCDYTMCDGRKQRSVEKPSVIDCAKSAIRSGLNSDDFFV
ncbi:unnamed protein product [Litomosoides sigmodontis]|uniref:Sodium/potassium-transporting ATPase subunit beta-1-interacting protein n=1 Tax=Litomosoides sigmodontis TaxID=42156 RepID=A0A3P6TEN6_LITSI|nr:unnamed protein product [Litomosoides sigmodontis]